MTTKQAARPSDVLDLIAADLGAARTLGAIVAAAPGVADIAAGKRRDGMHVRARLSNLLVTDPGTGNARPAGPRPAVTESPLVDAVQTVDDAGGTVAPYTVEFNSAAAETAEGDPLPESTLTYTVGAVVPLPSIGHTIPVTKQALRHNATLEADINTFLVGGVVYQLEAGLAATLAAAAGTVAHPFDSDIATTLRTAVAAAQSAMPELGPGLITVALSPADHAALDLTGGRLADWPATVISSPALPAGTAYVSRFGRTVQLYANTIEVSLGLVNDQFVTNQVTARAYVEALAHLAAPAAIIKAALA